jgi:hypothetical protein
MSVIRDLVRPLIMTVSDSEALSAAATLLDTWADANGGLAFDFTDITATQPYGSGKIIDGATPANNWETTASLDPFDKFTFARASTAYYYNSAGVLTQAASGAPRIDYNPSTLAVKGLLVEEQRTNSLLYSSTFTDASWTKDNSGGSAPSVTANYGTAPDGTSTASRIQFDKTGGSFSRIFQDIAAGGTVWTGTVWMKTVGGGTSNISIGIAGTYVNQVVTGTWTRFETTNSTADADFQILLVDAVGANDETADLLVWGAQLEQGAFSTSYIPTTSATVTRIADDVSVATTAFNHSATAGTLYSKFRPMNVAAIRRVMQMDDGTANERIVIGTNASAAGMLHVVDGGADQTAPLTSGTAVANTVERMAASWAANDFALSFDGGAAATDTSGTLPTVTTLRLGSGPSSAEVINGWIEEVMHLPIAKSDADLALIGA